MEASNFGLHEQTRLRTLVVDGNPEILLGVACLELRVRDDLGHVCEVAVEVSEEGREGEKGMQALRRVLDVSC